MVTGIFYGVAALLIVYGLGLTLSTVRGSAIYFGIVTALIALELSLKKIANGPS